MKSTSNSHSTTTTTITVTTPVGALSRRIELNALATTSTPTRLPTYLVLPCKQRDIYGSACACLDIPRTTSTAPTPVVTTTVTVTTSPTATATPTCIPGACGAYEFYSCPEGTCSCGSDPDNNPFCFVDSNCGSPRCTVNADCAAGFKCVINSCCDPICVAVSSSSCVNPALQLHNAANSTWTFDDCTAVSCTGRMGSIGTHLLGGR